MQMKVFDDLTLPTKKTLVKWVEKACRKMWLSLQTSVDIVYSEAANQRCS